MICKTFLIILLGLSSVLLPTISAAQDDSINVMSFNIRYNNPDDGADAWPLRRNQLVSVILFHQADVIGMQEAQADQLQFLEEALPDFGWCGEGRLAGGAGEEFCAIFFRKDKFQLLESQTFWLSETPEVKVSKSWDSSLPRIMTIALLKEQESGRTIAFLNTHFDHRGEVARRESADIIVDKVNQLSSFPLILTGDFNCELTSIPLKNLEKVLDEAARVSLIPGHGPKWTFHGFQGNNGEKTLIDFILVNNKVKVLRHANLTDNINGRFPSDHLPVLVEISIVSE